MAIDPSREFKPINIAALTVSDTRTAENDTSGDILAERVTGAGHNLTARLIVKDDAKLLAAQFDAWIDDPAIDAIVSTGGTGLTGRDVTPEALTMIEGARDIPGFGELFRWLS
ncbi:MAG: molybdopterin-binding protein, partial [Erythrobacter sp.]|nr:molybdopterin-binding protein [Erythrobacter sp.]